MIRDYAYGVADRTGTLGLHPTLVAPPPTIDIDSSRERVHPWFLEPIVVAEPASDQLHLYVVRCELTESNQRADVDLGAYLHLLADE